MREYYTATKFVYDWQLELCVKQVLWSLILCICNDYWLDPLSLISAAVLLIMAWTVLYELSCIAGCCHVSGFGADSHGRHSIMLCSRCRRQFTPTPHCSGHTPRHRYKCLGTFCLLVTVSVLTVSYAVCLACCLGLHVLQNVHFVVQRALHVTENGTD